MKSSLKVMTVAPIKVLLAEGDKLKQREKLNILKKFGYQVDIAESGLLALDKYDSGYDIVIAGSDLKNVNSLQLTEIIHSHRSDTNVLLISESNFKKIFKQVIDN